MATTIDNPTTDDVASAAPTWPNEAIIVRAADAGALVARLDELVVVLSRDPAPPLADVAFSLNTQPADGDVTVSVVAADLAELLRRLTAARDHLRTSPAERLRDPSGSYYEPRPLARTGDLAVLFPGEGTQYVGMLADLRTHFPVFERQLAAFDASIGPDEGDPHPVSRFFVPPSSLDALRRAHLEQRLRQVDYAMFAVLAADTLAFDMLRALRVEPAAIAGHSAGELAALSAADSIDPNADVPAIVRAMRALGEAEQRGGQEALLLATAASRDVLLAAIAETLPPDLATGPGQAVFVAMDNCPHQAVVVGWPEPMARVEATLRERRVVCERLPFSRPYHTPLFAPFMGPLTEMFDEVTFRRPSRKVYSCTTAQPFPDDPNEIRALALAHWSNPVEFQRLTKQLHADGIRLFVEAGPRGVLSAFVADILRGHDFAALPCDQPRRSAVTQWNHLVAQLAAHGVPLDPSPLYAHRPVERVELVAPRRTPAPPRPASPPAAPPRGDSVIERHLALMERFLDDQRVVWNDYLRTRGQRRPAARRTGTTKPPRARVAPPALQSQAASPVASPPPEGRGDLPLRGSIVRHEPGQSLLIRRRLDLADDLYALDHAVGGVDVSRMNPQQRGMPVVPMTFILEMMAEAAVQLVPGLLPIAVSDIQIQRWLPVDEDAASTTEIEARLAPNAPAPGTADVQVEVRDLGFAAEAGGAPRGTVAVGRVTLARAYPQAPAFTAPTFTDEKPCGVSLGTLYRNLFHGPMFQGVRSLDRFGREGLLATLEVLPRDGLFRGLPDPHFLIDPVTVDVGMHPACGWHLEQADQSGRILLPFEMKKIEFFGPSPPVGAMVRAINRVDHASPRQFVHSGELAIEGRGLWCRLTGVKCWRFYLPLCEVNFNGPKDEYFISKSWPEALPRENDAPVPNIVCVRLDPTGDLSQSAMLDAAARVTLSDRELRQYKTWRDGGERRTAWLFGGISIKDAARLHWHRRSGERMFIADLDVAPDQYGRPVVRLRDGRRPAGFPAVAMAQVPNLIVALAADRAWAGVGIAAIGAGDQGELDDDERRALAAVEGDEPRRAAWAAAAREALRQGLGPVLVPHLDLLRVRQVDATRRLVFLELDASLAAVYPELQGRLVAVSLVEDDNTVVATVVAPQ